MISLISKDIVALDRDWLLHDAHQQLQSLPELQEQDWDCLQKNIFAIPYCDECIECLVRDWLIPEWHSALKQLGRGGRKRFWNLIQKMIVLGSPGLIELCFNNITPFLEVSGHLGVQKWSKFSWKLAENGLFKVFGHMVLPNGWIRVDQDWI